MDTVDKTQQFTNAIPFLRTPHLEWNAATKETRRNRSAFVTAGNNTFTAGFDNNKSGMIVGDNQKRRVKQIRRENGWDSYVKPIS